MLNVIVEGKMDPESSKYYEQIITSPKELQKLDDVLKFIEERFNQLEAAEGEQRNKNKKNNNEKSVFVTNKTTSVKCVKCEQPHLTQSCEEFKKCSVSERFKIIKNKNACINCLHPAHTLKDCKSKHACSRCGKKHHSLLHNDEWKKKPVSGINCHLTQCGSGTVLFPTALIR